MARDDDDSGNIWCDSGNIWRDSGNIRRDSIDDYDQMPVWPTRAVGSLSGVREVVIGCLYY